MLIFDSMSVLNDSLDDSTNERRPRGTRRPRRREATSEPGPSMKNDELKDLVTVQSSERLRAGSGFEILVHV